MQGFLFYTCNVEKNETIALSVGKHCPKASISSGSAATVPIKSSRETYIKIVIRNRRKQL